MGGLWACLGFFALNVSTDFLFRNFVSFKEKASALRKKSARTTDRPIGLLGCEITFGLRRKDTGFDY